MNRIPAPRRLVARFALGTLGLLAPLAMGCSDSSNPASSSLSPSLNAAETTTLYSALQDSTGWYTGGVGDCGRGGPGFDRHGFGFGRGGFDGTAFLTDLTAEQRTQIRAVFTAHAAENRAIHDALRAGTATEAKAQHDALRATVEAEIYALLTPDQQARIAEAKAELARGEVPTIVLDARVAKLTTALTLTAEQQSAARTISATAGRPILASHATLPTDGTRPSAAVIEAHHAAVRAALETERADLRALLTAEQQAIFDQLHRALGQGPGRDHGSSGGHGHGGHGHGAPGDSLRHGGPGGRG